MPADNSPSSNATPRPIATPAGNGFARVEEGHLKGYYSPDGRFFIDPTTYHRITGGLDKKQLNILAREARRVGKKNITVVSADAYIFGPAKDTAVDSEGNDEEIQDRLSNLIDFFGAAAPAKQEKEAKGSILTVLLSYASIDDTAGFFVDSLEGAHFIGLKYRERSDPTELRPNQNAIKTLRNLYGQDFGATENSGILHSLLHEMGHAVDDGRQKADQNMELETYTSAEQFAQKYAGQILTSMGLEKQQRAENIRDWVNFSSFLVYHSFLYDDRKKTAETEREANKLLLIAYGSFLVDRNGKNPFAIANPIPTTTEMREFGADLLERRCTMKADFHLNPKIHAFMQKDFNDPLQQHRRQIDLGTLIAYMLVRNHWASLSPLAQDLLTRYLFVQYWASGAAERREQHLPLLLNAQVEDPPKLDMRPILQRLKEVETRMAAKTKNQPPSDEWLPDRPNPLRLSPSAPKAESNHG